MDLFLAILRDCFLTENQKISLINLLKEREDYGCYMDRLLEPASLKILINDPMLHPLLQSVYIDHAASDVHGEENIWKALIQYNQRSGKILFEVLLSNDKKAKYTQFISCWMSSLNDSAAVRDVYHYIVAKLDKRHHKDIKKIADFQILSMKIPAGKKDDEGQFGERDFLKLSRRYNFFSFCKTQQEIVYEKLHENNKPNALRAMKSLQYKIEKEVNDDLRKTGDPCYFQLRR